MYIVQVHVDYNIPEYNIPSKYNEDNCTCTMYATTCTCRYCTCS